MKKLTLIILILCLQSCSSAKSFLSKDKSTKDTKTEIIETTKKGGVTTLSVPNIIRKDTTIYTVNRHTKTILSTKFDKNGAQTINCEESELNEKITRIEEKIDKDIKIEADKKTEFNPQYLVYSIIGLGIVLIIGMFVFSYLILKIKKQIVSVV